MKIANFFVVIMALPSLSLAAEPQQAVVISPVADVWREPTADLSKLTDDKRETQVLFGEKVLIHDSSGPWIRIEAVEQPTFRQHNKWEGYPGWVFRSAVSRAPYTSSWQLSDKRWEFFDKNGGELPLGAKISVSMRSAPLPNLAATRVEIGVDILKTANLLIDVPYVWGGLTPGNPPPSPTASPLEGGEGIKYGVDCSGLVHLSYRVNGMTIPRDAHEQWMKAKPIKRAALQPADLIFSAKADNPKTITHVALYAGDGLIIEAPQTGMAVRKISFKEKYGKALDEVESGDRVGERIVYFGSYLQ